MGQIATLLAALAVLACSDCAADPDQPTGPNEGPGASGAGAVAPGVHAGEGGEAGTPGAAGSTGVATAGSGGAGTGAGVGAIKDGGSASPGGSGSAGTDASDGGAADAAAGSDERSPCLDGITDYASAGPFDFELEVAGTVKLWVPQVPAGCRVPIVHFSNGTGGTCNAALDMLERFASHGFMTACTESTATGNGMACMTAIETVLGEHPDRVVMKVASTGHGTGGGGAMVCLSKAEERWGDALQLLGYAVEPDLAGVDEWTARYPEIGSPLFMFNGSADGLVSDGIVRQAFDALDPRLEVYWYEGVGATHVPMPWSHIHASGVAWLRWKLLGDRAACEHLTALPDSAEWDLQEQRNPSGC